MLKFFRKNARGWFMLIFMAIIIFVFVLYFGTDRGARVAGSIAVIDGTAISEAEYYNEYSKMVDRLKEQYGGQLSADMIKQMDVKTITFDNLINRYVIIAKAKDLKIQVSDEEVRQTILSIPALQTDGQFDNYKYQHMLRYNRTPAEEFENGQKVNLAAVKIEMIIREGTKVSDQEVLDLYTMQNQTLNLNFVQIDPRAMKPAAPKQEDLESYRVKNTHLFRIPEQVKIKYLSFSADQYTSADVTESDIKDYYERRKENFKTQDGKPQGLDEVKGRIAKEITKERGLQNAFEEAKKARAVIYENNNFDAYAAQNKLNVQAVNFFPLNNPPEALAPIPELALQLAAESKGDITKVLSTGTAYCLIYIEDKKAPFTPPLKDIEQAVRAHYLRDQADTLAQKEAEGLIEALRGKASLEKLAAEKGLKISETGMFLPGDKIPQLGAHPEATSLMMSLTPNQPYPAKPLNINNTYVVFKLKDRGSVNMAEFEANKEAYRKALMNLKREETMKSWLGGNRMAMIQNKRLVINKDASQL